MDTDQPAGSPHVAFNVLQSPALCGAILILFEHGKKARLSEMIISFETPDCSKKPCAAFLRSEPKIILISVANAQVGSTKSSRKIFINVKFIETSLIALCLAHQIFVLSDPVTEYAKWFCCLTNL